MTQAAAVETKPFYLEGNYAPVARELIAENLEIHGAIPPELTGRYLRNGPNPQAGSSAHWFFGDGMVHGVELERGRVHWYRNRWVQTRSLREGALLISETGEVDRTVGVANTHVIGHAGRIFALVESSYPTELSPDLETIGVCDFDGKLRTAMTAHPKRCPRTGELHFFGYGFMPPYLTYHVLDASGRLVRSEEIAVPGPTMMHDFAITDRSVIFMDLPICFDLERALRGTMPYAWSDDYGARVGVMPRKGKSADVRWYEIEPCYVFHPMNAYEDDEGRTVVDVARYDSLWRDTDQRFDAAKLHRWVLDPRTGRADEIALDDRAIEFPRIDERLGGSGNRYGYAVMNPGGGVNQPPTALVKYDLETGSSVEHEFGRGRVPGEGVFVPAGDAAGEDEGWVLTYVYDAAENSSDFVVLDAQSFAAPPVATVRLPQRVPYGFHGSWIAG
jgi:carotenoid cleavage dioxygenase-like enzyme